MIVKISEKHAINPACIECMEEIKIVSGDYPLEFTTLEDFDTSALEKVATRIRTVTEKELIVDRPLAEIMDVLAQAFE